MHNTMNKTEILNNHTQAKLQHGNIYIYVFGRNSIESAKKMEFNTAPKNAWNCVDLDILECILANLMCESGSFSQF